MSKFQRRNMPSHSLLRSFESASRHESFTLAAEELNLTQSAISRQVKELELIVGAALFRRAGRRVFLTRSGRKLASDLAVDLENLRRTVMRAISAGDMGSTLRIAVLPTFASRWLVPRIPKFQEQYPDVEINLSTRLKPFDLEREHFDLAIHHGHENWPDTDMRLLCSEEMVPVASPAFLKKYAVSSLQDIARVPLLHMSSRPTAWSEIFATVDIENGPYLRGKYFDQFSMVIAGAVASLAVALLPTYLIENELSSGALQVVGDVTLASEADYYLVTPAGQSSEVASSFCDWMVDQVGTQVL